MTRETYRENSAMRQALHPPMRCRPGRRILQRWRIPWRRQQRALAKAQQFRQTSARGTSLQHGRAPKWKAIRTLGRGSDPAIFLAFGRITSVGSSWMHNIERLPLALVMAAAACAFSSRRRSGAISKPSW
jgi:hypothetical protein